MGSDGRGVALAGALWASSGVTSIAVGDLDHSGALDIVSGGSSGADYEVVAWRNLGSDCCCYLRLAKKK